MTTANPVPRTVKIIRWTARIWSIVVSAGAILIFFSPNSLAAGPILPVDIFLPSLVGVNFLGLFIAWRWELVGGIFTIAMLFIRELAFVILKGYWEAGLLILWLLIAPPAILFLVAYSLERKTKEISQGEIWLSTQHS